MALSLLKTNQTTLLQDSPVFTNELHFKSQGYCLGPLYLNTVVNKTLHPACCYTLGLGFNHLDFDRLRKEVGLIVNCRYECRKATLRKNNYIELHRLDKGNCFGKTIQRAKLSKFFGPILHILINQFNADHPEKPCIIPAKVVKLSDACTCQAYYELWKHIPGADLYIKNNSPLWINDNQVTSQIRAIIRNANHIFKMFRDSPELSPYKMNCPYTKSKFDLPAAVIFELDDYPA